MGNMTEAALLDHITRLPHGKANFKQLIRELGPRISSRTELETMLARLAAKGDLLEIRAGHFAATRGNREFVVGRLSKHRDGYGFLIPDRPLEGIAGDIFIPADAASSGMHGDRAVVRIARIEAADAPMARLSRFSSARTRQWSANSAPGAAGFSSFHTTSASGSGSRFPKSWPSRAPAAPIDRIGLKPVEIADPEKLDGMIVNVELLEYPRRWRARPVGRVIEILGSPDDFGIDVEIVIRKYHLPHRFPPEVVEQAESIPGVIATWEVADREDFRALDVVTIDGETARDFDDAVWVDRLPNGNFALQVHIADVSHYVRPGTPIDAEARLRGTSVYFPDRAVPMLPFELSTNIEFMVCEVGPPWM